MYLRNKAHDRARVVVASVCVLAGLFMFSSRRAEAHREEQSSAVEARKLKNPLTGDAATVEAGKKIYQRNCAGCHGPGGKGDGSMALSGGTPSDLTDDVWDHGSTDGEIFMVIRDGVSSDMLAYKGKLTDEQIWQVITFIRSIGPKSNDNKL
ncbi:MAG TPA: c-type cytochrome [Blastocatellia bacterium]|nr:c-type cytochrome [Blastocatellia bacterium]